ncbi:MAG: putative ABC transport system permease protein [Moritella sp.]|jgi:putative ABC transport system permease protein
MNIIFTLAWRNLWRHRTRTWITISAMVFSNVLLVFMLSLQVGTYQMMIDNALNLFTGHLQVQDSRYLDNPKQRYDIDGAQNLATQLRQQLNTDAIALRGSAFSLLSSEQRSFGAQIVGVQPDFDKYTSSISGQIKQGRYLTNDDSDSVILGATLAKNLKLKLGDEVTLLGSDRQGSIAAGFVTVVGIFATGLADIDRNLAQLPLSYFQSLYGSEERANYIVIRSPDALQLSGWKAAINKILATNKALETYSSGKGNENKNGELWLRDWDELQPGIKQAIQADISGAIFMYVILIVLVSFSVMNTQLMSVLERTREFGTVMALGLRPTRLSRLILLETTMMAVLGLVIGVVIGMSITAYLHVYGFSYPGMEDMAAKFNMSERLYPSINWLAALAGPSLVMIFSVLATIYPAMKIRRLAPLDAMRAV